MMLFLFGALVYWFCICILFDCVIVWLLVLLLDRMVLDWFACGVLLFDLVYLYSRLLTLFVC